MICIKQQNQIYSCILFADSCLCTNIKTVQEKRLNEDSGSICVWFADNKLCIHFGDYKTKSILFASKQRAKNIRTLNIK